MVEVDPSEADRIREQARLGGSDNRSQVGVAIFPNKNPMNNGEPLGAMNRVSQPSKSLGNDETMDLPRHMNWISYSELTATSLEYW